MDLSSWLSCFLRYLSSAAKVRRRQFSRRANQSPVDSSEHLELRQLLSASPVGTEPLVNTTTAGDQITYNNYQGGAVAMDADGDYVVTWSSNHNNYDVYAQRYNAAGVAQGGEFQVNTNNLNNQQYPAVAMSAAGDFVVTWTSKAQDGHEEGVYAQRYNAAGAAQGGEFRVNTFTSFNQFYSKVAMDADGDFVVTWSSSNQDGSQYGVYAQRYDAAGVAQGTEFRVNTTTLSSQNSSTVAMNAAGDFVVTWTSYGQDGSELGVYAQRYNAEGVAQGGEFQVNTYTTINQTAPTVAMDADGDFVVTWSSYGQDFSGDGVYAQRYNAAGVAQGGEFRVNTHTTNHQRWSTVAMDADGDFVVTWSSRNQDGSGSGVYAQQYNAAGVAQGGEFRVNTTTANSQDNAAVAMDAEGDFVVAWNSYGQDGDGYGVYAQRYAESTDTAGPIVAQVFDDGKQIIPDDQLVSVVPALTVVFSEDLDVSGGAGGANSVTNPANWALTRDSIDVSGTISGITFGLNAATNKYEAVLTFSTPLAEGAYQLTALPTIQDLAGNALDGDFNGTPDGTFTHSFLIDINEAPILTTPAAINLADTAAVDTFSAQTGTLNATDADLPAQPLTYGISGGTLSGDTLTVSKVGAYGTLTVTVADGSYSYAPNASAINALLSNDVDNFSVNVSDGSLSDTSTLTVNLAAANDTPILSTPAEITLTETAAVDTFSTQTGTLSATDADLPTQTLTYGISGGTLSGDTLTVSKVGAYGTLTVTVADGSYSYAPNASAINALLSNDVDNFSVTVSDGSLSDTKTLAVNLTAANDTPVLGNLEAAFLPYAPTAGPTAITTSLALSDADNADMAGAVIQIAEGYQNGDLLEFTNFGNITGSYDGNGTLTLSGNDTVANYQTALRSVTYSSSSQSPQERMVSFQVNDGTNLSKVDFRSIGGTTQLVGATLNVYGTPSADIISISEGELLTVVVNGSSFDYTPASVTAIDVFGFAGDDAITVRSLTSGTALTADGGDDNDTLNVLNAVTVDTTLLGGAGNDRLTGGRGGDTLVGGVGDDMYVFRTATLAEADLVVELANQGSDTLSFATLTTDVQLNLGTTAVQNVHTNRTLRLNSSSTFENAIGGSADDTLIGNSLGNRLTGGVGNDRLTGGGGDDVTLGGKGDDTHVFANASSAESDTVTEYLNQGTDTLTFASVTSAVNVHLGSSAVRAIHTNRTLKLNSWGTFEDAVGGSANDTLKGNQLANRLKGNAGNDRLTGAGGNDVMMGGTGDDIYIFAAASSAEADMVTEAANGGVDTLTFSSLSSAVSLHLGTSAVQNVHTNRTLKLNTWSTFENATGGTGDDLLRGNALANTLIGNSGDDILVGHAGIDQILGGAGRDILIGGLNQDILDGGSSDDILIAGRTTGDASITKLSILRAEWIMATPYATRTTNLRAGVGTPKSSLKATVNVLNDAGEMDTLKGGFGRDWYFNAIDDVITDLLSSELTDVI